MERRRDVGAPVTQSLLDALGASPYLLCVLLAALVDLAVLYLAEIYLREAQPQRYLLVGHSALASLFMFS